MKSKYIIIIVLYLLLVRKAAPAPKYVTQAQLDEISKKVSYLREEFDNRQFA
jgi:hypothetical protein